MSSGKVWLRPPSVTVSEALVVLEETVARFLHEHSDVSATIVTDELYRPLDALAVAPDCAIAQACRAAYSEVFGAAPPDDVFPGATDSFFIQGVAGVPTIPAMGPGRLTEAHQPNEYVSLESLEVAPTLLAAVANSYLSEAGSSNG